MAGLTPVHPTGTAGGHNKVSAGKGRNRYKETIEATALPLFKAQGVGETHIAEIVSGAGISKKTLYKYYPSKKALAQKVLQQHFAGIAQMLREADNKEAPVAGLIKGAMCLIDAACESSPAFYASLQQEAELQTLYNDFRSATLRNFIYPKLLLAVQLGEIRDDVDIDLMGYLHFHFLDQMVSQLAFECHTQKQTILTQLILNPLRGILAKEFYAPSLKI